VTSIIHNGLGCLTLDSSRVQENIRFYPGHYMAARKPESGNTVTSLSTILGTDLPACPAYRGMQERLNWKYVETSEGQYNFSWIQDRLTSLQLSGTDIRKLCLMFVQRTFSDNHCVPDYMLTDPLYDGGDTIHSGVGNGYMIKWQNHYIVEKFRLMINAMAESLNGSNLALRDNPQLAMIAISETATGSAVIDKPLHYAGLGQVQEYLVRAFPRTMTRQITNYPGPFLDDIFANIAAGGIVAIGGPDTFDDESGLENHQGYSGLYPRLRTLKDDYIIVMEVQNSNYDYSNLAGTGGYAPTKQQLLNFNKDPANWYAHIVLWDRDTTTNAVTGNANYLDVQTLLNESAQTADAFGGLNKTRPLRVR